MSLHNNSNPSAQGVEVLACDTSSLNRRILEEGSSSSGQGIWCKEDGCVFDSIFCPFCVPPHNSVLGVHVLATDALNLKLQNKILFFLDSLEIENFEAHKRH
ncbi:unnamed protein product [Cuscuta campestris]|nr:unnamed protein product [Cuscuta campestris]